VLEGTGAGAGPQRSWAAASARVGAARPPSVVPYPPPPPSPHHQLYRLLTALRITPAAPALPASGASEGQGRSRFDCQATDPATGTRAFRRGQGRGPA